MHPNYKLTILCLIVAVLLTACGQGVLDVQVVAPSTATPDLADLESLQPLAAAVLAGGLDEQRVLIEYQFLPCAANGDERHPACQPGEAAGSLAPVLPLSGVEPAFVRPADVGAYLPISARALYAVYARPERDTYGLLFERYEGSQPAPVSVLVRDGLLVGLDFHPQQTPEQALNRIPVAQVLLPPAQARPWSEPLQAMQVLAQSSASPDQAWLTHSFLALPPGTSGRYYRRLDVVSQDGAERLRLVSAWDERTGGYSLPLPLQWFSRDISGAPVLYWSETRTPDGCVTFSHGSDLHRLDLSSGQNEDLLEPMGQSVAVSPGQDKVAVIDGAVLTLVDLAGGARRTIELPAGESGQIVWAPDGQALAFTLAHNPCAPGEPVFSVLRLDLASMALTMLSERDPRQFSTQSWSQLGLLQVADKAGLLWQMDPISGAVWDPAGARPTQPAQGVLELPFLATLGPQAQPVLAQLAQDFSARYPAVRIVFTNQPADFDYLHYDADAYLTALAGENACMLLNSLPDEFSAHTPLLALDDYLAAEPALAQDFYPALLERYRVDGRLYALPLSERPSVLSYNADLLARLNLPAPSPDWRMADFIATLEALAADPSGMYYGFAGDDTHLNLLADALGGPSVRWQAGLLPQAQFDTPAMLAGLERLAALRRSRAVMLLRMALFADADVYSASDAWQAGQVAFWQGPAGVAPSFSMLPEGEAPAWRTAVAVWPRDLAYNPMAYSVQEGFYILNGAPVQTEACWQWYRFLSENAAAFDSVPARRSVAQSPQWQARVGAENAAMLLLAQERLYTAGASAVPAAAEPLYAWLHQAVRAFLDGASAPDVLSAVQRKADAYSACLAPTPAAASDIRACANTVDPALGWP